MVQSPKSPKVSKSTNTTTPLLTKEDLVDVIHQIIREYMFHELRALQLEANHNLDVIYGKNDHLLILVRDNLKRTQAILDKLEEKK